MTHVAHEADGTGVTDVNSMDGPLTGPAPGGLVQRVTGVSGALTSMTLGLVASNVASTLTFLSSEPVSYTHLRAHETVLDLVCRLLLEKKTQ